MMSVDTAPRRRRRRHVHFPETRLVTLYGTHGVEGEFDDDHGDEVVSETGSEGSASSSEASSQSSGDGSPVHQSAGRQQDRFVIPGIKPAFKLKERRHLTRRRGSPDLSLASPAEAAERVRAQFVLSRKTNDLALMREVVDKLNGDAANGLIRKKITQHLKDESLLYCMLSGNSAMTRLLLDAAGASVQGADTILDESKGVMSSCQCGKHPGILLVTLTRQGAHEMVELALQSGLDPNTSVCDGEAEYMLWRVGMSFEGARAVKTPILLTTFAKSTALIAAAMNSDVRMARLLIDHGAKPDLHRWAAVAQAAQVNDPIHQVLSYLLVQIKDDAAAFRSACAVALKGAASRGHEGTVAWIFEQLELREDWGALHGSAAKRLRRRRTVLASASSHTLAQQTAKSAAKLHNQRATRRNLVQHASSSSSSSSAASSRSNTHERRHERPGDADLESSCLNESSMREYGARRRSLVRGASAPSSFASLSTAAAPAPRWTPSAASVEDAASEDLATSTVSRAMDMLIDEAVSPGYVHREAFVRGIEALAQMEKDRCGSSMTLARRAQDLYKIFLNTLEEGNPMSARESALALLDVGVENFLGLGLPPAGSLGGRGEGSSRSLSDLSELSFEHGAAVDSEGTDTTHSSATSSTGSGSGHRWPWGRVRHGLQKMRRTGSARTRRPNQARRASGDEQALALATATKGGHTLVVKHLLSNARPDLRVLVPRLLIVAAEENFADTVGMLIDFVPEDMGEDAVCDALNEALAVALAAEAIESTEVIIESGAAPDSSIFVRVMTKACTDPSYTEDAVEFLAFTMTRTKLHFALEDVKQIIGATVTCDHPNLYSLATMLDMDESFRTVVDAGEILTLIDTSSLNPNVTEWQDLLGMLLKCIEDHEDHDDIMRQVYAKAAASTAVHPGVIGLLAAQSSASDEDSDRWV